MADMFDKWNEEFDFEGLNEDLKENEKNGNNRSYKEVEYGTYEVAVNKMEVKASKEKRNPMMVVWFKISAGEFKNSMIFYNQVINNPTGIHFACEMLRSMELECVGELGDADHEIFKDFRQFNNLLMDAMEEIEENGLAFELEYSKGKNGFNNYKITEVFED